MDATTVTTLLNLNRRFYEQFGAEFAQTRQRIQNGVRRVLDSLPDEGSWLDIGCGSGSLAAAWLQSGRASCYTGVDFSEALLEQARKNLGSIELPPGGSSMDIIQFRTADLSDPHWAEGINGTFRGIMAFAVFHHLPSRDLRLRLLRQVHGLLSTGGRFYHSEWQFHHAPKLMARRLPWSTVGLDASDLEPGDTLLDWRFSLPGKENSAGAPAGFGLRYVHLFDDEELADLARDSGFRIVEQFESDGQGGRLGLYQVWEKASL